MALIPIEHARRLNSPAEAEAFFRGLGTTQVRARGFHTNDAARMARLVAAIEPKEEHTISFVGGALGPAARSTLDALALSTYEYLDVRACDEALRIWPALPRIWVHTARNLEDARASLGSDAGEVVIERRTLETKSIPIGLRLFHSGAPEQVSRGFISGVEEETKPLLLRFLEAVRSRVDAVLEIDATSRARSPSSTPARRSTGKRAGSSSTSRRGSSMAFSRPRR